MKRNVRGRFSRINPFARTDFRGGQHVGDEEGGGGGLDGRGVGTASVYGAAISIDRHGRTDAAISPSALAIF